MKMVILIDNGHGSNTAGKCSPDGSFREYKWTREVAAAIVCQLSSLGYEAHLLVPELTDVSLSERCRRVNNWCNKVGKNNVLLVSVHNNAAASDGKWHTATGWSTYTTRGITEADKLARSIYLSAEKNLKGQKIRKYGTGYYDWDFEENFYILLHTYCPAVLVENFFQDNRQDVAFLTSTLGKQKCIDTIVDGVINYIKSK